MPAPVFGMTEPLIYCEPLNTFEPVVAYEPLFIENPEDDISQESDDDNLPEEYSFF